MKPLEPPDSHYVSAATGWLELGNEEKVNEDYWRKFEPVAKAIWAQDPAIILVVGDFSYHQPLPNPFDFHGADGGITNLAVQQKMGSRQTCMEDRVQVFMTKRGQVLEMNAAILRRGMKFPAVDCDPVPPFRQADGQLLGESFKAAVVRRDSAGTYDGDTKRSRPQRPILIRERLWTALPRDRRLSSR